MRDDMANRILDSLRSLMVNHSPPLDALIIPSADNHQSEYVALRDRRREFVSGFSGSAGLALITMEKGLMWTDGRYFLQATQQLFDGWSLMRSGEDLEMDVWISENLPSKAKIGVDPWCVSVGIAQSWEHTFSKNKQKLVQISKNLVDEVWKDRPAENISPAMVQPLEFAGRSIDEKLHELRTKLDHEKANGIVITGLDEVAWLYNVRGNDIPYSPVIHSFAIVTLDSAFFYVDERKVSKEVQSHLYDNKIEVRKYTEVVSDVYLLSQGRLSSSFSKCAGNSNMDIEKERHVIWADPMTCCMTLFLMLSSDNVILEPSPVSLPKALKNPVELDGLKKSHVRDGVAVVQFLVWLDHKMQEIYGASGYFIEPEGEHMLKCPETGKLTELSVSDKLEDFRSKQENFKGLSFPTISSVGSNAAINHYIPEAKTCAELDADKIYLFDSGGQYLDGTTDITRTVHFSKPSAHVKACYTAVLKGHIGLDTAIFPIGTTGHDLDVLARTPLWRYGLDYRHGTGHGIGSYLNVHEGPQSISFRPTARNVALQASMTVTDEPGYYEDGSFGIRLENVLVVKQAQTEFRFGDRQYLCFEHITWAPYQKKLMNLSLLTPPEIEWVDTYHSECRETLSPYLNPQELQWLQNATEPLLA